MPRSTKTAAVRSVSIDELVPDSRNANRGTERGRKMVLESLKTYGAGRSILLDRKGHIIAGNKTAEGAAAAGLTDVIVVPSDGTKLIAVQRTDLNISDKRARELAIADNRASEIGLEWDADVLKDLDVDLSAFFDEKELGELLGAEAGPEAPEPKLDKAAELQQKWGTKLGQIWEIGKHRLMCGSATDEEAVKALLSGHTPLLCVTDPPYGVNYDPSWRNEAAAKGLISHAARRVGKVANDEVIDWRQAWALFPGNVLYVWHAGRHASEVQSGIESAGFEVRCQIIWAKQIFAISRGHYHWQHEPCWYSVRKSAQAKWKGDRSQTTLWSFGVDRNVDGGHGTQKPLECMARAIRNHEGDVYEPFSGSGTTICAAETLKRRCYAMEIEPKYVAVALERLADMGLKPKIAR